MATFYDKGKELQKILAKESSVAKRLGYLKDSFEAECLEAEIELAKAVTSISERYSVRLNALESEAQAIQEAKKNTKEELINMSMDKDSGMVILNGE